MTEGRRQIVVHIDSGVVEVRSLQPVRYRSWQTLWRWRLRDEWVVKGLFYDPNIRANISWSLNAPSRCDLQVSAHDGLVALVQ